MRDGRLSYERFCLEAELLQKRSHEVARGKGVGEGGYVATWEWRHGNRQHLDGDSYLVSTGNVRFYCISGVDKSAEVGIEVDGDIDELLTEEDSAAVADEVLSTPEALHPQLTKTALLEFHIVYHTIYQTPVLYFRAAAIDGTPLSANAIAGDVHLPGSSNSSTFVAMEEHPVLGKPFSFLHPCETAGAMRLLQAQVRCAPDTEDQCVPRCYGPGILAEASRNSGCSDEAIGQSRGLSPRQMLAFFAFGGAITGPVLHYWYGYLETQRVTKEKLTPNKKLLLDRLVFTPPMVAFTIFSLGVLRGSSPKASRENLSRVYWGVLLMNWKVWTVTQWLSFHYVPPQLRVLWGNCVALWWNSYLSLTQN
ncbi:E2-like conjugating enzyme atg10 [Phytophthora boehmeriae]|uniref:E2-like conjugating enzyme atg10 n=1 Tax=Phytophthora boehmeriae TaxID=109152 RepID=A0A8T1WDF7_9STRA|nr:E2-like conjugating enzyme atg10 [Phytophthora boehmeriae]